MCFFFLNLISFSLFVVRISHLEILIYSPSEIQNIRFMNLCVKLKSSRRRKKHKKCHWWHLIWEIVVTNFFSVASKCTHVHNRSILTSMSVYGWRNHHGNSHINHKMYFHIKKTKNHRWNYPHSVRRAFRKRQLHFELMTVNISKIDRLRKKIKNEFIWHEISKHQSTSHNMWKFLNKSQVSWWCAYPYTLHICKVWPRKFIAK